ISGGVKGQATEIQIVSDPILRTRRQLNRIMAQNTGRSEEEIAAATERDNYMSAAEALDFGIIDQIIEHRETESYQ
ncbi:MAG: ATP-dependent Clp protease proteolytic subunit, partial [Acetatifactor sp.]|nr:ATP-dependent Clp protease proteolytic subunit [Acetatifactor sp.]